eukprot:5084769-Prymnesium_polylepis.3
MAATVAEKVKRKAMGMAADLNPMTSLADKLGPADGESVETLRNGIRRILKQVCAHALAARPAQSNLRNVVHASSSSWIRRPFLTATAGAAAHSQRHRAHASPRTRASPCTRVAHERHAMRRTLAGEQAATGSLPYL